jgi:hypothetical protein
MAVCLSVWKHKPVEGEKNPLTNWTGDGVKGLPIGKVDMSQGMIGKKVPGLNSVAVLVLGVGLYLQMA